MAIQPEDLGSQFHSAALYNEELYQQQQQPVEMRLEEMDLPGEDVVIKRVEPSDPRPVEMRIDDPDFGW
jgi:hypothetical protein